MSSKSQQKKDRDARAPASSPVPGPFESGVLPRGLVNEVDPETQPPWSVVNAYLTEGEHGLWVEGWAARSPAFAEVLMALRNDHEERTHRPRRRADVIPLKPRR